MHSIVRSIAAVSAAAFITACGSGIEVHTMAAPDAGLASLHSFRMLPAPARRDGRAATGDDDPMINNSIANRAIRDQIVKSFQDRGYTLDERRADFAVAFYATARAKLDVSVWDYGYPFNPAWPHFPGAARTITQYTEGTIVIDVVRPGARELLWRGEGKGQLSDDASDNVKQLVKAARGVIAQFPHATIRTVASGR
jgi:hypothetical protein